jgi:hypothetical protein
MRLTARLTSLLPYLSSDTIRSGRASRSTERSMGLSSGCVDSATSASVKDSGAPTSIFASYHALNRSVALYLVAHVARSSHTTEWEVVGRGIRILEMVSQCPVLQRFFLFHDLTLSLRCACRSNIVCARSGDIDSILLLGWWNKRILHPVGCE